MKRRSILPTVFDRCGFNNYTVSQLSAKPEKWNQLSRGDLDFKHLSIRKDLGAILFDDWLPQIQIPTFARNNEEGAAICTRGVIVSFDASYIECPKFTPKNSDPNDRNSDAACINILITEDLASGESVKQAPDGLNFDDLVDFINNLVFEGQHVCGRQESCRKITIESRILVHNPALYENEDLDPLIRRKELVSRELTTVYRRMITLLEAIILTYYFEAPLSKELLIEGKFPSFVDDLSEIISESPTNLTNSSKSLHATREDSWRLLANFGKIAEVMDQELGLEFANFQEKVGFLAGHKAVNNIDIHSYFEYWEEKHFVPREVIFKKTLEYFIHKALTYNW